MTRLSRWLNSSALRSNFKLITAAAGLLCLATTTSAQNIGAEPLYGTANLAAGFLPDPHVVEVAAGGADSVDHLGDDCVGFIASGQPDYDLNYEADSAQLGFFVEAEVDTTLVINDPAGNWHCNDDASALSATNPGILFSSPLSGNYNIWVGSYLNDGVGNSAKLVITEWDEDSWSSLNLDGNAAALAAVSGSAAPGGEVDFGDDASTWANDDECDDQRFQGRGMAASFSDADMFHDASDCRRLFGAGSIRLISGANLIVGSRIERGRLSSGDSTRANDSYSDTFTFIADRGDSAVIDLRSGEFDTYLIVRAPGGEEFTNDDYESSFDRSLLSLTLAETGIYEVVVSSYNPGETGGYTVQIATDAGTPADINTQIQGELTGGDATFDSGEFNDSYSFEGRPGQRVTLDLRSDEFDTYLILRSPNGESQANDDAESTSHSLIETELTELGSYEVIVTSFAAAETGGYVLNIRDGGAATSQTVANRDVINLDIGDNIEASLTASDSRSDDRKYEDSYVFSAEAGQSITVEMTSTAVDTYLTLITPSGESIENDDHQGSTDQSLVQLTLQESGRYRVIASSYAEDETGAYRLSIRSGVSDGVANATISSASIQIYGIFAGIADYPGEDNDLPLTDQDARRVRDALIEGAGMNPDNAYTLIDSDATRQNFQQALNDIGRTIDGDDTLVIFFSGHGNRVPRADGPDSADPDGMDETMELYDGALLDDELADMLDNIDAGIILLVMDSCFSGGFSKDIISKPGRMGLFSSEEDVTSQVAFKFQAGGYLSVFFDEAIRGGYADRDNNGELTAIELSQYLHDRYRADVKSFGQSDYVRTSGVQSTYQHLVVDRGGIGPYSVLFTHN